jgi:hypothetical protein
LVGAIDSQLLKSSYGIDLHELIDLPKNVDITESQAINKFEHYWLNTQMNLRDMAVACMDTGMDKTHARGLFD